MNIITVGNDGKKYIHYGSKHFDKARVKPLTRHLTDKLTGGGKSGVRVRILGTVRMNHFLSSVLNPAAESGIFQNQKTPMECLLMHRTG